MVDTPFSPKRSEVGPGRLYHALLAIADMPLTEQDDKIAVNMRKIAQDAVARHLALCDANEERYLRLSKMSNATRADEGEDQ